MNASVVTRATDRLADYFAVIGVDEFLRPLDEADKEINQERRQDRPSAFDPETTAFGASVLSRYPVDEDYEDTPFPLGVVLFCFPEGVKLQRPTPPDEPLPTFFTFVATGSAGVHMYGHCLTFYEKLSASQEGCLQYSVSPAGELVAVQGSQDAESPSPEVTNDAVVTATPAAEKGAPYFAPKCLLLLSRWCFLEFRDFLTELYRLSLSETPVPLERIVCNFMMEVPLPPAGKLEVQYLIGTRSIAFKRPPANRRLSAMGLDFQAVFECLSVHNIVLLFRCLLAERQILFHSSQLSLLTPAAEIAAAMIYPFQWPHVYIPVLPRGLMQVLQAPMPFIIGMPTALLNQCGELPDTVVLVDLDNDKVEICGEYALPELPAKAGLKLIKGLIQHGDAFSHRPPSWATTVLPTRDLAFKFASRPCDDDDPSSPRAERYTPNWDSTRQTFFRFFVSLLADYRKYLVFPSPDNPRPDRFNKDGFVSSAGSDVAALLSHVVHSQAFINFVDERMNPENANAADIVFFDQSIDAKHNRSRLRLSKITTPFLDSAEFEIGKTHLAMAPDVTDLQLGVRYRYTPFPSLDPALFLPPRPVPCYADEGVNSSQSKLRRNPAVVYAEDTSGDLHSFEASVYTAWFLVFTAGIGNLVPTASSPALAVHHSTGSVTRSPDRPPSTTDAAASATQHVDGISSASSIGIHNGSSSVPGSRRLSVGNPFAPRPPLPPTRSPPPVPLRRRSSVSRVADPETAEEMHQLFLHQLQVAIAVLKLMQRNGVEPDEVVYRSLLEACGRCGSTQHAVEVLSEVVRANIQPDSSLLGCLLRAFAMDSGVSASAGPLRLLEWNKLQSALKSINPHDEKPVKGILARFRSGAGSAPQMKSPAQEARAKRAQSGGMSPSRAGFGLTSLSETATPAPSPASGTPASSSTTAFTTAHGAVSRLVSGKNDDSSLPPSPSTTASGAGGADDRGSVTGSHDDGGSQSGTPGGTIRPLSPDEERLKEEALIRLIQRPPGYGLLGRYFLDLAVDTSRETCPPPPQGCGRPLADSDIQSGWLKNPNDYTTVCPYCRAREMAENQAAVFKALQTSRTTVKSKGKGASDGAHAVAVAASDKFVACRFVARFAVKCSAGFWKGSTGLGTPLYCEYLSPWVLLKEVQSVLNLHGPYIIRTPLFREKCPTVFWNLVVYFERFRLPIDFLLPLSEAAALGVPILSPAMPTSTSSLLRLTSISEDAHAAEGSTGEASAVSVEDDIIVSPVVAAVVSTGPFAGAQAAAGGSSPTGPSPDTAFPHVPAFSAVSAHPATSPASASHSRRDSVASMSLETFVGITPSLPASEVPVHEHDEEQHSDFEVEQGEEQGEEQEEQNVVVDDVPRGVVSVSLQEFAPPVAVGTEVAGEGDGEEVSTPRDGDEEALEEGAPVAAAEEAQGRLTPPATGPADNEPRSVSPSALAALDAAPAVAVQDVPDPEEPVVHGALVDVGDDTVVLEPKAAVTSPPPQQPLAAQVDSVASTSAETSAVIGEDVQETRETPVESDGRNIRTSSASDVPSVLAPSVPPVFGTPDPVISRRVSVGNPFAALLSGSSSSSNLANPRPASVSDTFVAPAPSHAPSHHAVHSSTSIRPADEYMDSGEVNPFLLSEPLPLPSAASRHGSDNTFAVSGEPERNPFLQ